MTGTALNHQEPKDATGSSWVSEVLRPGDLVVVAQGTGEPTTLLEHLVAEAENLRDVEIFVGLSHTDVLRDERARMLSLLSFGAMGPLSALAAADRLSIIPCTFVDVPRLLTHRAPDRLVIAMSVGPASQSGTHSLGLSVDYTFDLLGVARAVVAEVNEQIPSTTAPSVPSTSITASIATSRGLPAPKRVATNDVHLAIAGHVATLVRDGSTIQLGVGAVPTVVGTALASLQRLRVRSTLVGDWLVGLSEAGALSGEPGSVVISEAAGSARLHRYAAGSDVLIRSVAEVTRADILAATDQFVSMNSALQVDLSGQVNAEELSERYVGGVGGQPDFLRAAQRSAQGRSIVMLPATTSDREASRIVARLHGDTVTTPRSGVDFVVTEHGVADLRGRSLAERARALISIAAPQHQPQLRKALT
jgi:acyl-CoA hydrolase